MLPFKMLSIPHVDMFQVSLAVNRLHTEAHDLLRQVRVPDLESETIVVSQTPILC